MQESFKDTMYVYECPLGHRRYWIREPPEGYEEVPCEVCGGGCIHVDSFEFNPFNFEPPARLPV